MDTILNIVGIALAIAGLVPAFTSTHLPWKIALIALSLSIAGIFCHQLWVSVHQHRLIEATKQRMAVMMSGNQPLSFEQIYERLNYPTFEIAATAVNELEAEGVIHQRTLEVQSAHGGQYKVRVFNSVNFGIE